MANTMVTVLNAVTGILLGIKTGLVWFLFASPVIGAFVIILIKKQFKNSIILRQKTKGDTDKVLLTSFRIKKTKGEPESIKTWKRRLELPIPPDDAIDIKENGAWFVEGYITEGGEITWLTVDSKREIKNIEEEQTVDIGAGKTHKIKTRTSQEKITDVSLNKLSTQDKSFYFNRLRRANEKYAIGGFWDFLNRNAGIIALVMVVFVIFLFWADIMQPAVEMKDAELQRIQLEKDIIDKLEVLIKDRQKIGDAPVTNVTGTPEPPE